MKLSYRKYTRIFKNSLGTALEYRSDLAGIMALELIGVSSILMIWWAIFSNNETVGGLSVNEVVLYYIFVPIVGFFTHTDISQNLAYVIRRGDLSNILLKPYKIWVGVFVDAIAKKIGFILFALPIYFIALALFSFNLVENIFNANQILMAFILTILAFLLHFTIDLVLSWLAFWITDVWSFKHFKVILFSVLGGVSFPLEFLPDPMRVVFEFLPFKYMYYVPISYLMGKSTPKDFMGDIAGIATWAVFFLLIAWVLWVKGLKKYEAFGN